VEPQNNLAPIKSFNSDIYLYRKDPKYREWCHWIVGNIPGSDYKKGDPVWDYVGSAPPKGSTQPHLDDVFLFNIVKLLLIH